MKLDHLTDCARAAEALRRLVGGDAERFFSTNIPASLALPNAGLIVAAGDHERPLDPFELKALALREDRDVMAIWVDAMLAGHAFLIDVVLTRDGQTEQYGAYRLWMRPGGRRSLVPALGSGPTIVIDETGLRPGPARPWRTKIDRLTGLTLGQAWIHRIVWGGTPYEAAVHYNLDR